MNPLTEESLLLETTCPRCKGIGVLRELQDGSRSEYFEEPCWKCGRTGLVPTKFGRAVLAMIAHRREARAVEAEWRRGFRYDSPSTDCDEPTCRDGEDCTNETHWK